MTEFIGAMDNPHVDRHKKESLTIGSKPLPLASEKELTNIMRIMDERAKKLVEEGNNDTIYLSMELDHPIATDAVAPIESIDPTKIFTITRDIGSKYEKDVKIAIISKEDMQKQATTNLIHAIYGPDEGKMVNYTVFFGAMAKPFPRELSENATPDEIEKNNEFKEYWDNHVFLATPEEVQKVIDDLKAAAQNGGEKSEHYAKVASTATIKLNLFKKDPKSPVIKSFKSKAADYEIPVTPPKSLGGKVREL